jgi:hypothetical protein
MYRKDERMIKEGLQEKGLMYEDREQKGGCLKVDKRKDGKLQERIDLNI